LGECIISVSVKEKCNEEEVEKVNDDDDEVKEKL